MAKPIAALSALLYAESQWRDGRINAHALAEAILEHAPGIEAEAYAASRQAAGLSVENFEVMRVDRGWPTPISMRRAADALDHLTIPRYGDVLRWVADQCDAALDSAESEEDGE